VPKLYHQGGWLASFLMKIECMASFSGLLIWELVSKTRGTFFRIPPLGLLTATVVVILSSSSNGFFFLVVDFVAVVHYCTTFVDKSIINNRGSTFLLYLNWWTTLIGWTTSPSVRFLLLSLLVITIGPTYWLMMLIPLK
jgi:hypothetical protein